MEKRIYLDYHATTPVDPRVLERMLPYFTAGFGNAASAHSFGWEAQAAVEVARQEVAALAGAEAREVVFTSGATESDNLAIKGVVEAAGGGHVVTLASEHRAVLDSLHSLERRGTAATVLRPQSDGRVDLEGLRAALRPDTVLVSVMYANNEIGVVQPMAEIAAICRQRGVLLHSDAVQALGRIPVDMRRDGIDLMSLTAHKMYGPKGVGALVVRRGVRLAAQMDGGGHEGGLRSGTLNVPGIAGFGAACALAAECLEEEGPRLGAWRDRLLAALHAGLDGVHVNGALAHRLPGNLNVSFAGVEGDALLGAMPERAVSAASACGAHGPPGSHVLQAIGTPRELAQSALRFGLGRFTTKEEVDYAAGRVVETVRRLRADNPWPA